MAGSAQNPLSLNRYLYANANPGRSWIRVDTSLDAYSTDTALNLTGSVTKLASGKPEGISINKYLPFGGQAESEGGNNTLQFDLPLDAGSIGLGAHLGLIGIPHTGGMSAPGVDTETLYAKGFETTVGFTSVEGEVTVTHHDVSIPGPNAYYRAGLGATAVAGAALFVWAGGPLWLGGLIGLGSAPALQR